MKTKLINILLFAITLLCVVFLPSCMQKDTPCVHDTTELDISSSDFAKVPYTDTTKLTFVRTSTNDTFTFTGQGWITDYGTTQTQEDCYQIYKLQRKRIAFVSPTYPKPIILAFQYYSPQSIDYLEIDFTTTTLNSYPNTYIVSPGTIISQYQQYDSLTIQQKTYYNIRYFKNDYQPEYNTSYGCYYNKQQGILRMETNDGDKWELIKVH